MLKRVIRLKVFSALFILVLVTGIGWAMKQSGFSFGSKSSQVKAEVSGTSANAKYDETLLLKLENACKQFDDNKEEYTFEGTISIIDKADSAQNIPNSKFLIVKKGEELYFKLGDMETMNWNGLYIQIDHSARKVGVSEQKQIISPNLINVEQLKEALQSEEYELLEKKHNGLETISLINEGHITCKEYSVTMDTLYGKISRFYTRLTNMDDPLSTANEKVVDLSISKRENKASIEIYKNNKVVQKKGEGFELTDKYSGYELIRL